MIIQCIYFCTLFFQRYRFSLNFEFSWVYVWRREGGAARLKGILTICTWNTIHPIVRIVFENLTSRYWKNINKMQGAIIFGRWAYDEHFQEYVINPKNTNIKNLFTRLFYIEISDLNYFNPISHRIIK